MTKSIKEEESCKDVILKHINSTQGWVKKADLYPIAEDWLAETVGRACRDLEEHNEIQKDLYDGKRAKGLVMYSRIGELKPLPQKPNITIKIINGVPTAILN